MPQIGPIQGASMANAGKAAGEMNTLNNNVNAQKKSGQVERSEDKPDRASEYRNRRDQVTAAGNPMTGGQTMGTIAPAAMGINQAAANAGQPETQQQQAMNNQANANENQNNMGTNEGNQPQSPGKILDMLA